MSLKRKLEDVCVAPIERRPILRALLDIRRRMFFVSNLTKGVKDEVRNPDADRGANFVRLSETSDSRPA